MSPLSRGIASHIPSLDSVLLLTGASHPCISLHLLIATGFLALGLGSLETSTLLPLPLYGCWGALEPSDFSAKDVCSEVAFLDSKVLHEGHKVWVCGKNGWWQTTHWPGAVMAVARLILAVISGLIIDAIGRKRSAVVWMGVYFAASLARSFSPNEEVFITALTVEAVSSQIASIALLLIATEGSVQKECVRSGCLVLMGHGIGCVAVLPLLSYSISSEMYRQLARSIPSAFFIVMIFFLPESVRWIVVKGRLEEVPVVFQKSHNAVIEDSVRPKISAVYNDMRKCLKDCRSQGGSLKQSLFPLFLARPLWRIFTPSLALGFMLGGAIGFRLLQDPLPHQSIEDRVIACGVAEILALQSLGLLFARLPVRRILFALSAIFAAILLLTRALKLGGYTSCVADIFYSTGGHFVATMLWVWLLIGVIRITPTHCRATVLGFVSGFATLGHALSRLVFDSLTITLELNEYFATLIYAGVVIVCGLVVLLLPSTPSVLPDMTSHIAPHLHWPLSENTESNKNSRTEVDTRL